MKKYHLCMAILLMIATSCKKNMFDEVNKDIPKSIVQVTNKQTEISKTNGTTPSIVFVGGFGADLSTWENLYTNIHPGPTIFAYNRAGIGASENITGNRDATSIAREMKAVLEANNIPAPYILVAHSMGGIYARMFYHLNPSTVKGLVLIDATHENQLDSLLSMLPQPDRGFAYAGMMAVNDSLLNTYAAGSVKEEFRANFSANYAQIKLIPTITSIPIYVITSTKIDESNPPFVIDIKKALHQQWALQAGSKGKFIETNRSGHFIQIEEPTLVAEGIKWVLSK